MSSVESPSSFKGPPPEGEIISNQKWLSKNRTIGTTARDHTAAKTARDGINIIRTGNFLSPAKSMEPVVLESSSCYSCYENGICETSTFVENDMMYLNNKQLMFALVDIVRGFQRQGDRRIMCRVSALRSSIQQTG